MEFGIVYVCCFVWDISVLHKEKAIRIIYAAVRDKNPLFAALPLYMGNMVYVSQNRE